MIGTKYDDDIINDIITFNELWDDILSEESEGNCAIDVMEIRNGKHKCHCDYDTVIRVIGCRCGGW